MTITEPDTLTLGDIGRTDSLLKGYPSLVDTRRVSAVASQPRLAPARVAVAPLTVVIVASVATTGEPRFVPNAGSC
jgi:hypothetical protein